MRLLGLVVVLAAVLTGCATSPSDLAKYGSVELESQNVKSLTIDRRSPVKSGNAQKCVAITVRNDSVTMTQAGGYIGPYTGNYYQTTSSRDVGGGSVTQFVSADGADVVARGETKFSTGLAERSLRFTVNIKEAGSATTYRFTGIEQAGTTNGYGYHKIAAMAGTGVEGALAALSSVVDEIENCMR